MLQKLAAQVEKLAKSSPEKEPSPEKIADYLVAKNFLTRWQADKLLEGRHKGFFLGKYKLLDHLGTGGMSSVYLAEHVLMKRRVAIKVLPHRRVGESSYLDRFYREAQAAAALKHPNIVMAHDFGEEDGTYYLVMEYVEGQDLQEMVKQQGPLAPEKAAHYIYQAALGLHHAHESGMVHRDVKPGNLLVDSSQTVKVLDLGLARFTQEESGEKASLTLQHNETVLGTADYLAPEQCLNSHQVDHRADIYSLGCTLYYLLAGRPPFNEGTMAQRMVQHVNEQPPDLLELRPELPLELVELCRRMMAKQAEERPQSMQEVAEQLLQFLQRAGANVGDSSGKLVSAVPGSGALPSSGTVKRRVVRKSRRHPGGGSPGSDALSVSGAQATPAPVRSAEETQPVAVPVDPESQVKQPPRGAASASGGGPESAQEAGAPSSAPPAALKSPSPESAEEEPPRISPEEVLARRRRARRNQMIVLGLLAVATLAALAAAVGVLMTAS